MALNKDFLGQGWTFPPGFDVSSRATLMVKDLDSIISSLNVLMGTTMGERLMQPQYGTSITEYFFRNVDASIATLIQTNILDAIIGFEPRIAANKVTVDTSRMTEGILLVTIDFTVRTTNSRNNIVFPFYIKEGNLIPLNLQ